MALTDVKYSGETKKLLSKTAELLTALMPEIPFGMTVKAFIEEAKRITALPPIFMRTADLANMERSGDHPPGQISEWQKLEADIRANGVHTPLALTFSEGSLRLVDGVSRVNIAVRHNIEMLPVRIFIHRNTGSGSSTLTEIFDAVK